MSWRLLAVVAWNGGVGEDERAVVRSAGLAGRGLACGLRLSGPGAGGAGGDPEGGE
ncbi:MAG TPA: hypothetical protein VFW50_10725 [Streptosporangiaceae bacterium]|nr:hypothetical protein [Streptosporangiaceae bacterium]